MGSSAQTDICTCDVCKHYRVTVCHQNKCACCSEMDTEYLSIYADDEMRD